jgi:RNA polymerase sigma-70 factor (ECF subfamily)
MSRRAHEFELLVRGCSADLYRYAYWLSGDRARAEDLVQETLLRAWRSLDTLRDPSQARSWLITTLRREFARGFDPAQPKGLEDVDTLAETLPAPETLDAELERDELIRRMAALPRNHREALVLQILFGYRQDEVAQILGATLATVNNWLFRGRRALLASALGPPAVRKLP